MEYLFSLKPNQTLSEGIKSLSKFQISGFAYSSIVERGYGYFRDGAVYPNVEISLGKYELEVSGSYGAYEVVIEQNNSKINASCDCPFDDGTCKHIIASLLHLQNNVQTQVLKEADITAEVIAKAEKSKSDFEQYVHNLPMEKLRQLVLKFAPEHFRKEVTIKQNVAKGNTKKVASDFKKAAININTLFDGEPYDIGKFIKDTDKAIAKLRPFWQTHPNQIVDELASFIQNVDEAFEEGYLYGHYDKGYDEYAEDNYEGEEMSKYIGEFIATIPHENRQYALLKLLKSKENLSHSVCDTMEKHIIDAIKIEDLPTFTNLVLATDFLNYIHGDNSQNLYNKIQEFLSEAQKEQILLEQMSDSWFNLELAKFYEAKSKFQKAYDTLSTYLRNLQNNSYFGFKETKHTQFQMIIRLCDTQLGGKNTMYWIEKYIQTNPSINSFQTAIKHRPEKRTEFESHFEKYHVTTFVKILETENKLNQALQLFKKHEHHFRSGHMIYSFLQRHKTLFPEDAKIVFKKELDIYLPEAKQRNYEKIGEILSELKPILSESAFKSLVSGIKGKYKRRTNLMGILSRKGF